MKRSRIQTMIVAANRLEQDGANPKLIAALREFADLEAKRLLDGRDFDLDESKRVERQRTLMAMVSDTRPKDSLMAGMLQRAYDLMWDGMTTECDAICEFLPSSMVEKMFESWQSDQEGKAPKSKFYSRSPI